MLNNIPWSGCTTVYPFSYWRISWLLPNFCNDEQSCYKHPCVDFCVDFSFQLHLGKYQGVGLPWWLRGKEFTCNAGNEGLVPELGKSPWEGNGNPLPVFLLGKSHGQRSLVGYSPWGCIRVGHNLETKQQLLLENMIRVYLALYETTKLYSKVPVPFCIPTSSERKFFLLHILTNIWCGQNLCF